MMHQSFEPTEFTYNPGNVQKVPIWCTKDVVHVHVEGHLAKYKKVHVHDDLQKIADAHLEI